MPARFFVDLPLTHEGQTFDLPSGPARHAQVLRLQPGALLRLFDGRSPCEWHAEVTAMGRSSVAVRLLSQEPVLRELPCAVALAVVMPANDRMDFLVEKATELGAASLQPLTSERSVLRLSGERADKKVAHWQAVAQAAAEQCGRVQVPKVGAVMPLSAWLREPQGGTCWLASPGAPQIQAPAVWPLRINLLTGPEGGLSADEESQAQSAGFARVGLGPRILRADTAPLALLAWLGLAV
jgi:16S rRNA (uracil1498-N3)-methyltransferase